MKILKEEMNALVRKSTKGSFILILGQFISTFIIAAGIIYISRVLGPTDYGIVTEALAPISIGYILVQVGIDQALIKYLSQLRYEQKNENQRVLIESGLIISTSLGLLLSTILYLASRFIAEEIYHISDIEILTRYLSFGILFHSIINTSSAVIIGYERMSLKSYHTIVISIIRSVTGPLLVFYGYGPIGAALGEFIPLLLGGLIGLFLIFLIWKSEKQEEASMTHIEGIKLLMVYGFPIYLSNIVMGIRPHLNIIWLSHAVTEYLIGNYGVAMKFCVLIGLIINPISQAMLPLFSKLEKDRENLAYAYLDSVKYISLLVYPVIASIMALSNQIIGLLYNETYPYASLYVKLILLTYFFIGLGSISNNRLFMSQKMTKTIFNIAILQNIVTIPLNFLLIHRYGIIGLLISELLSPRIGTSYSLFKIKKEFNFMFNFMTTAKVFVSAILAYYLTLVIFNRLIWNQLIEIIFGTITTITIYLVSLIALKAITKNDVKKISFLSDEFGPLSGIFRFAVNLIQKFMSD